MDKFLIGNEAIEAMLLLGDINELEAEIKETKSLKSADYIHYFFKKYGFFTKSKKQHLFGQKMAIKMKREMVDYLIAQSKEIKVSEPIREAANESLNIVDLFLNPKSASS